MADVNILKNTDEDYIYSGNASAKVTMPVYKTGSNYQLIQFTQTASSLSGISGAKLLLSGMVLAPSALWDVPYGLASTMTVLGVRVRAVVAYYQDTTLIRTFTSAWFDYHGVQLVQGGDPITIIGVYPMWTEFQIYDPTVVDANCNKITFKLQLQNRENSTGVYANQHDIYLDACSAVLIQGEIDATDSYLYMDREIFEYNSIYRNDANGHLWMNVTARGLLGTLPCKHKKGAIGRIIKVIGGYSAAGGTGDFYKGHPLHVLLTMLTSTEISVPFYYPEGTTNTPAYGTNVAVSGGKNYSWDMGSGWGLGIPLSFIDWSAISSLAAETTESKKRCEFRFTQGIKNFKEWSENELLRPFGYRWALGVDGKISVAKLRTLDNISEVATITERDCEGVPDMGYINDIVNQLTWKFDNDPSNSVDNRQNSRFLSLDTYTEASFWDIAAGGSSMDRYDIKEMQIKSSGMRGVATSRFANGYNMEGSRVAAMVSYDFLLRWREMIPQYKMTVGMDFLNLDVGDVIRLKNANVWEYSKTGYGQGVNKVLQISNVRHDYSKKKIILEAHSLTDIQSPAKWPDTAIETPAFSSTSGSSRCDVFVCHFKKKEMYDRIKALGLRDYPFQVANLFFICQCYNKTYGDIDDYMVTWTGTTVKISTAVQRRNLAVPTFTGYRHTNVRVYNELRDAWIKVAEFNEPYIYFAWEADGDTRDSEGRKEEGEQTFGPKIRISYSSKFFITDMSSADYGTFKDKYNGSDSSTYKEFDLSGAEFDGVNLEERYTEQARERLVSERRYFAIGNPGEYNP